mgnify:CR=1 FL=1
MILLYRHQFTSTEGLVFDEEENYNNNFLRWCKELEHFTGKDWSRAYKRIESDVKEAARMGKDIWPPSSLAVVAYSEPPICSQMYKAFDRSTAVEDLTAKEERYRRGQEESSKLLSMFD